MNNHDSTVAVMKHLKQGYGVEDIEAMGIASADFARGVVARLRDMGLLKEFLKS
jgi:hypothetical protein